MLSTAVKEAPHHVRQKTVYLPGLNGLRAIAALAVVFSHITLGLNGFGLNNRLIGTDASGNAIGLPLASYGVTIFFTLSGFLITYLLLKEKEVAPLKIKEFYIRRILRIWPLYYMYLAICIGVMVVYGVSFDKTKLPFFIFLAANVPMILGKLQPLIAHYWSLGVEEQFYLFFPQLAKYSNRKLLKIAGGLIFGLLSLKFVFWVLYRRYGINLPFVSISLTRFHTMLIGVVGAIFYYYGNAKFLSFSTHKITQAMCWFVLLLIAVNKFHVASVIDDEIVSVLALFLIMGQVTKKGLINLENKVCDFIGKISYGIYVIHPLLIFLLPKMIQPLGNTWLNYLFVYLLVLGSTLTLAFLSYQYYEKPFLKQKAKYATVRSANSQPKNTR